MKYLSKKTFTIILALSPFLTWASSVNIKSNPDTAEVFVLNVSDGKPISVGETPFEGNVDDLGSRAGGGNSFVIEIKKVGFEPYRVLMNTLGGNDIELSVNLKVSKDIELVQDIDLLMSDLFDVQRLVRGQDYASALTKLTALQKKFPHFSIIPEMTGGIHYLNRDFTRAMNSYRKAFSLNAKNQSAYRMKKYLEKRFGLPEREPAQGE